MDEGPIHSFHPFLQLKHIQEGGQQVNSHRCSKGQNQVPVGEHISQSLNPFSLLPDQQPDLGSTFKTKQDQHKP